MRINKVQVTTIIEVVGTALAFVAIGALLAWRG